MEAKTGRPTDGNPTFYIAGGTMRDDAPSYVARYADEDLFRGLLAGDFCYVLTTRQMGKSSLMVRTCSRLRENGASVVLLDLTSVGQNVTAEQWYTSLLHKAGQQLSLKVELLRFWQEHSELSPLLRWMRAIQEVALLHCPGKLVIFIDEIDFVRSLPFSTDEFFAAIRESYNRRTQNEEFNRLTFCFLGVATPSDLIQNTLTTPFNIGRRIELTNFTEAEATGLAEGLGHDWTVVEPMLARILYWSGGHPYLTQRLCQMVAADNTITTIKGIDRLCNEAFFIGKARERDANLLFVRERILRSGVDQASLLDLYRQVISRKKVRDDETNPLVTVLRLSGIVRVQDGYLTVRNRIYGKVFDHAWVLSHMPDAEVQRQHAARRQGALVTGTIATMIIAIMTFLIVNAYHKEQYLVQHSKLDTGYFANKIDTDYGPIPFGSLTPEQAAERNMYYKFSRHGTRENWTQVETMHLETLANKRYENPTFEQGDIGPLPKFPVILNPAATDSDDAGLYASTSISRRECRWDYEYDSTDPTKSPPSVTHERTYDLSGHLLTDSLYIPQQNLKGGSNGLHFAYIDEIVLGVKLDSGATYVRETLNSKGWSVESTFTDALQKPVWNAGKVGAIDRVFEPSGLVSEVSYWDRPQERPDRKPVLNAKGCSVIRFKYDTWGNNIQEDYYGVNGQSINCAGGYSHLFKKYDDQSGNLIEERYVDREGKPCNNNRVGFYRITARYDENGNPTETTVYNVNNQKTLNKSGYCCERAQYDPDGTVLTTRYYGTEDEPLPSYGGTYGLQLHYADNKVDSLRFLGPDGKSKPNQFGVASLKIDYDLSGYPQTITNYDEGGHLFPNQDGYARSVTIIDKKLGEPIEKSYYGSDGSTLTLTKSGFAQARCAYDWRGLEVERRFVGATGNPVMCGHGYSRRAEYDEGGREQETKYFGIDKSGGTSLLLYTRRGNRHDGYRYLDAGGRELKTIEVTVAQSNYGSVLKAHDILYSLDGHRVTDAIKLHKLISLADAGRHTMTLRRDGQDCRVTVSLNELIYADFYDHPQ